MSKIFIANWKSNKTEESVLEWLKNFDTSAVSDTAQVIIAPPFQLLSVVKQHLDAPLKLAAQDLSSFPMGSYTGAVNAQQLKSIGVEYVIVGHSERRKYFHESNEDIAAKINQAVENNLKPILCVDDAYISSQASAMETTKVPGLIVAYEPLSAIGTGNNASLDMVNNARKKINSEFGEVPVLYGGSVDERTAREYLLVCDGVLVGGASLDADSFQKVVADSE